MMTPNNIGLNDFKRQWEEIGPSVLSAIESVGRSGWYILGQEVSLFEKVLADFFQSSFAVGVANGMDAIEIALRSAGIRAQDSVLTTPLSAFATTLAVLRLGAKPVFVDTDDQGLIDLNAVQNLLKVRSDIRAILPVHLYGRSLELQKLKQIKDETGLIIIEDCAQSIGAKDQGQLAGTVGDIAATSFYPTKNLGALGDGGALFTSNEKFAKTARCLRNYGQSEQYIHSEFGLNSRLDEVQAALLRQSLFPKLLQWNKKRSSIAEMYLKNIKNENLKLPQIRAGEEPVWHLFPVIVRFSENENPFKVSNISKINDNRNAFQAHLKKLGVNTGIHYPRLIPTQQALIDYEKFEIIGNMSQAQVYASSEVSLPIHPYLTEDEVQFIIDACNGWII